MLFHWKMTATEMILRNLIVDIKQLRVFIPGGPQSPPGISLRQRRARLSVVFHPGYCEEG
jgi:hypothetical protein